MSWDDNASTVIVSAVVEVENDANNPRPLVFIRQNGTSHRHLLGCRNAGIPAERGKVFFHTAFPSFEGRLFYRITCETAFRPADKYNALVSERIRTGIPTTGISTTVILYYYSIIQSVLYNFQCAVSINWITNTDSAHERAIEKKQVVTYPFCE